ncbi:hypothetical protein J4558_00085 [Leptolyngbya sp. 15MV]|nr:hypothetical protein J4558_00085 [Leptolyngbya sp. 15MV]
MIDRVLGPILAWADRPSRIIAIFLGGILVFAAVLTYEFRVELSAEILRRAAEPRLDADKMRGEIDRIQRETGAPIVIGWRVSLAANEQVFVAAATADRSAWVFDQSLPFAWEGVNLNAIARLMSGREACFSPANSGSAHMIRLAEEGIRHVCAVPVPGVVGAFVGLIHVGWRREPSLTEREAAIRAARSAGNAVAQW